MAEDKKPDSSKSPVKQSVVPGKQQPQNGIAILNRQDVSNTRPAPSNPHRESGGTDKDDKR